MITGVEAKVKVITGVEAKVISGVANGVAAEVMHGLAAANGGVAILGIPPVTGINAWTTIRQGWTVGAVVARTKRRRIIRASHTWDMGGTDCRMRTDARLQA